MYINVNATYGVLFSEEEAKLMASKHLNKAVREITQDDVDETASDMVAVHITYDDERLVVSDVTHVFSEPEHYEAEGLLFELDKPGDILAGSLKLYNSLDEILAELKKTSATVFQDMSLEELKQRLVFVKTVYED